MNKIEESDRVLLDGEFDSVVKYCSEHPGFAVLHRDKDDDKNRFTANVFCREEVWKEIEKSLEQYGWKVDREQENSGIHAFTAPNDFVNTAAFIEIINDFEDQM